MNISGLFKKAPPQMVIWHYWVNAHSAGSKRLLGDQLELLSAAASGNSRPSTHVEHSKDNYYRSG